MRVVTARPEPLMLRPARSVMGVKPPRIDASRFVLRATSLLWAVEKRYLAMRPAEVFCLTG